MSGSMIQLAPALYRLDWYGWANELKTLSAMTTSWFDPEVDDDK
jgi:hypothetical protein